MWQHFQLSQYDTPPLRDVNEFREAFAASVCKFHYYQSMEQADMELHNHSLVTSTGY